MIDALLYAVRDSLRLAGFGYGVPETEIMADAKPPPRAGNIFVSIYEGGSQNNATRNLDEYFAWNLCLTMRISVPLDRVGDTMMASKLARKSGAGQPSFDARLEQLRAWGHMNWTVGLQNANANIVAWSPPNVSYVYGFVEPAHFVSAERATFVGPDWFSAMPEDGQTGLKAELRFDGARRMQPQTEAIGPFV